MALDPQTTTNWSKNVHFDKNRKNCILTVKQNRRSRKNLFLDRALLWGVVGELTIPRGQVSIGKRGNTFNEITNRETLIEHGLPVLGKGLQNSFESTWRQMF